VKGKMERLQAMSPETKETLRQQWADLFKEAEAALDKEPASPVAQELVDRWLKLLEPFSRVMLR